MRRGIMLVAGACVALVLGGVGHAAPGHPPAAAPPGPAVLGAVDSLRAAAAGDLERVGTTEVVADTLGPARRAMTLSYPGASYVKVHLGRLVLPRGGYVTVSNLAGTESYRYAAGDVDRWAMSIDGDTAVVSVTAGNALATVDRVARGFTPRERAARRRDDLAARDAAITAMRGTSRAESVCGTDDTRDAVCYRSSDPVAYANSLPVARLLINGDELCTAWRVGPDNRMLTNHHCFTATSDARDTEVWFGYACVICGTGVTGIPTKVWGDQVLSTDATLDYTLFTVQGFDTITSFGYLDLDVRDPSAGEQLYVPQHPGGDPTVIAMASDQDPSGNCQVDDPSAEGYAPGTDVAYYCDTAPGSSGSPVLSRATNKVVALHHFGGCPNSGVRIDLIYQRIASLL